MEKALIKGDFLCLDMARIVMLDSVLQKQYIFIKSNLECV